MKVRALAGVLAMLGGTASGQELFSRLGQGDVNGNVQLCEPREDATGVLREVRRLDVHTPGKNFFLRPAGTGAFEMLGLPLGTHVLNVEDPDGKVLAAPSVNVSRRSVTRIDIPVCPDRDEDLLDQSKDCDDAKPEVAGAVEWFPDGDGDGFGDPSLSPTLACVAPPGSVRDATDCRDGSPDTHPGQTAFFTAHRGDGSFDYNCDGVEERSSERQGRCATTPFGFCVHNPGWTGTTVPACGESADFVLSCTACFPNIFPAQQACR
jgi:hypothetical protein